MGRRGKDENTRRETGDRETKSRSFVNVSCAKVNIACFTKDSEQAGAWGVEEGGRRERSSMSIYCSEPLSKSGLGLGLGLNTQDGQSGLGQAAGQMESEPENPSKGPGLPPTSAAGLQLTLPFRKWSAVPAICSLVRQGFWDSLWLA